MSFIVIRWGDNMNSDVEEDVRADAERTEDEETVYEDENDDRWMRKRGKKKSLCNQ